MTSKRPELREKLSVDKGFYMILCGPVGVLPEEIPEIGLLGTRKPWREGGCDKSTGYGAASVRGYCWAYYRELEPDEPYELGKSEIYRCNDDFCYVLMPDYPYPDDPYQYLGGFVHEFAHAIDFAIRSLDDGFEERLKHAWSVNRELGIWNGFYADVSWWEYWAEGTGFWFYGSAAGKTKNPRGPGSYFKITREELKARDPLLYELLDEWYPAVSLPRKYDVR